MSEHTKGRLHQCSHSDKRLRDESGAWVAATDTVRRSEIECTANSRRLTACWNRLLPFTTEEIEQGIDLVALQSELTAARALLREALIIMQGSADDLNDDDISKTLESFARDRISSYLDACDTLGGNSEVGS